MYLIRVFRSRRPALPCLAPVLHDLRIIHTDIKIENILLVDSAYTMLEIDAAAGLFTRLPKSVDVQLIDFGSVILQV
jgi:dual-specificity kinase